MPGVMWVLVILAGGAALFWWLFWLSPAQRRLLRFVYNAADAPDVLNGCYARDDVRHPWAGDPPSGVWPSVTVIVAGRNEGHLLAKTLGSICAMDYPGGGGGMRVVFVDDQSTDDTREVCRELQVKYARLKVIHNEEAPRDGWVGKTWAVHQAAGEMGDADYLLFADADLEFHPQCLKQMVRLARHRGADFTSLLPRIVCRSPGELLGLLGAMTIINMRLPLSATNDPRVKRALVAGGFLLAKRESYEAVGGHAAVRGQVVEDIALGTRAKALGLRVFTAITFDLYRARMFEGTRDAFRGLKKNAYAGANYRPGFAAVIAVFLMAVGVLPLAYAAAGVYWWVVYPTLLTFFAGAAGVLALLGEVAVGRQIARYMGMWRVWAWVLPLGFLFYWCVFIGSVIDHHRGGNTWAGRRVTGARPLAEAAQVK
jgi:glycosyltransferase involved in cell wall biosynthesis